MTSATTVTTAQFRAQLSEFLERSTRQPVVIASRGTRSRGVLVSADFFERACIALGEEPYARPPLSRQEQSIEETMSFIRDL